MAKNTTRKVFLVLSICLSLFISGFSGCNPETEYDKWVREQNKLTDQFNTWCKKQPRPVVELSVLGLVNTRLVPVTMSWDEGTTVAIFVDGEPLDSTGPVGSIQVESDGKHEISLHVTQVYVPTDEKFASQSCTRTTTRRTWFIVDATPPTIVAQAHQVDRDSFAITGVATEEMSLLDGLNVAGVPFQVLGLQSYEFNEVFQYQIDDPLVRQIIARDTAGKTATIPVEIPFPKNCWALYGSGNQLLELRTEEGFVPEPEPGLLWLWGFGPGREWIEYRDGVPVDLPLWTPDWWYLVLAAGVIASVSTAGGVSWGTVSLVHRIAERIEASRLECEYQHICAQVRAAIANRNWQQAQGLIRQLPEDYPSRIELRRAVRQGQFAEQAASAIAAIESCEWQQALELLEQLPEGYTQRAELWQQAREEQWADWAEQAQTAIGQKTWEQAEELLAQLPEGYPSRNAMAKAIYDGKWAEQVTWVQTAIAAHDWTKAQKALKKLPADHPERAKLNDQIQSGQQAEWMTQTKAAIDRFEWAKAILLLTRLPDGYPEKKELLIAAKYGHHIDDEVAEQVKKAIQAGQWTIAMVKTLEIPKDWVGRVSRTTTQAEIKPKWAESLVADWLGHRPTHYAVFDLPSSASQEKIRLMFRRRSRIWHPDTWKQHVDKVKKALGVTGDIPLDVLKSVTEEIFKAISEAYEVLSDSEKRTKYDREQAHAKKYDDSFDELFGSGEKRRK